MIIDDARAKKRGLPTKAQMKWRRCCETRLYAPDVRVIFEVSFCSLAQAPILSTAAQQHILRASISALVGGSLHREHTMKAH